MQLSSLPSVAGTAQKRAAPYFNRWAYTMNTSLRTLIFFAVALSSAIPAHAGIESELKKMMGYTILHGGHVRDRVEKGYGEKYIQLDNGWTFKLDCLILMPLNFSDVIVFGKSYPEEVVKKFPSLPKHLMYQYKLLIDREVCDATLTK